MNPWRLYISITTPLLAAWCPKQKYESLYKKGRNNSRNQDWKKINGIIFTSEIFVQISFRRDIWSLWKFEIRVHTVDHTSCGLVILVIPDSLRKPKISPSLPSVLYMCPDTSYIKHHNEVECWLYTHYCGAS